MKTLKKLLACISLLIFGVGITGSNFIQANQVKADTDYITPSEPWRYKYTSAYYYDLSTSSYYQDVWNRAINSWISNGFYWQEASNSSKTTLSSYDGSDDLSITGKTNTQYNTRTGQIISNQVLLNRAALTAYGYSKSERVNVAEHELGHALGLAHNEPGSISVMNPSNRSYSIQDCDVRGMSAIYSTPALFSVRDSGDIITVTTYTKTVPKSNR